MSGQGGSTVPVLPERMTLVALTFHPSDEGLAVVLYLESVFLSLLHLATPHRIGGKLHCNLQPERFQPRWRRKILGEHVREFPKFGQYP